MIIKDEDVLYFALMGGLFLITLVIYLFLKIRKASPNNMVSFDSVEKWVDGTFAVLLLVALVFVTFRYS